MEICFAFVGSLPVADRGSSGHGRRPGPRRECDLGQLMAAATDDGDARDRARFVMLWTSSDIGAGSSEHMAPRRLVVRALDPSETAPG